MWVLTLSILLSNALGIGGTVIGFLLHVNKKARQTNAMINAGSTIL
jgi:hypothetical protein